MYWQDHAPPHLHAFYAGDEAQLRISDASVIRGSLPRTASACKLRRKSLSSCRFDDFCRGATRPHLDHVRHEAFGTVFETGGKCSGFGSFRSAHTAVLASSVCQGAKNMFLLAVGLVRFRALDGDIARVSGNEVGAGADEFRGHRK